MLLSFNVTYCATECFKNSVLHEALCEAFRRICYLLIGLLVNYHGGHHTNCQTIGGFHDGVRRDVKHRLLTVSNAKAAQSRYTYKYSDVGPME